MNIAIMTGTLPVLGLLLSVIYMLFIHIPRIMEMQVVYLMDSPAEQHNIKFQAMEETRLSDDNDYDNYDNATKPIHKKSNKTANRLEFVHITKTGGSAIEDLAAKHGVIWGACHFINSEAFGCYSAHVQWRDLYIGTAWHAPPKVIHGVVPDYQNPYKDADLFAVVRNPYDRAVSEYYCPYFGNKDADEASKDDPVVMNKWIQNMIQQLEDDSVPAKYYYKSPQTRKFSSKKHFINQMEYIYDDDGTRLIKHIIHFENLSYEFDKLMTLYNLNLTLPDKKSSGVNVSAGGHKKLSYLDLDTKTIALINRYAAKDFVSLEYEMVEKFDESNAYSYSRKAGRIFATTQ